MGIGLKKRTLHAAVLGLVGLPRQLFRQYRCTVVCLLRRSAGFEEHGQSHAKSLDILMASKIKDRFLPAYNEERRRFSQVIPHF